MSFQSYQPLRSQILSNEELKRLNEPKPIIAIRDTLISWLIILACWGLVANFTNWFLVLLVIPIIGTQYYSLQVIGHDGLHRRLFKSNKTNDLFTNCFIFAPIFAINRLNRINHMVHHRETSTEEDPDRHKYTHSGKTDRVGFILFITGLANFLPTMKNIFNPDRSRSHSSDKKAGKHTIFEIALILVWQLALLGGLTYWIGWWAFPVLWLLPVYMFTFVGDLLRVFCEHSMIMDDPEADRTKRLITYSSNPLERMFFAPHNMNYHAAHHLWPSIPYYNLPEADRSIRECSLKDNFIYRSSYLGYIVNYVKHYLSGTRYGDVNEV